MLRMFVQVKFNIKALNHYDLDINYDEAGSKCIIYNIYYQ